MLLCLLRRVPLASGWYLDAGWRWPSGDPFTCSTAWSPGFPTHHTSRGWHYWGYSILSQAGMHGEIFLLLLLFYKHLHIDANLWVIVRYVYVIQCASIGVIFQYRWYRYCYLTSGSWILTNGSWIQICIGTFLYLFLTEPNKEKDAWSHLEMVTLHSLSRRAAPSSKILPALCLQHIHAECSSAFTNQFCKRIAVKLNKFLFL